MPFWVELKTCQHRHLRELEVGRGLVFIKNNLDESEFKDKKFTSQKMTMLAEISSLNNDNKNKNKDNMSTVNDDTENIERGNFDFESKIIKTLTSPMEQSKNTNIKKNKFEMRSKSQWTSKGSLTSIHINNILLTLEYTSILNHLSNYSKYIAWSETSKFPPWIPKIQPLPSKNSKFQKQFLNLSKHELIRVLQTSYSLFSTSKNLALNINPATICASK